MSVLKSIVTVNNTNFATDQAVLLRDIRWISRQINEDLVHFIEEKIEETPHFLPYFYAIPRLNLKLNMVRSISDNQYEFGGILGEQPVTALVTIQHQTIQTILTALHNQEAIMTPGEEKPSHLRVA